MCRGEVWLVGGRPAVIVSNDPANKALSRVQVVPISDDVARLYPCEAYVRLNGEQRKAMADQIATIGKRRLKECVGRLTAADMEALRRAVALQLGFDRG